MFKFDEQVWTLAEMLEGNAHDEDVCAWLRTAIIGDVYNGCERIS